MNPPNMPPHLTLSFILQWWSPPPLPPRCTAEDETLGLPSRWDSTLLRVQSPKPVEILSKKSPEKLLLPHPTDLDLETLRSKDEAEAVAPWLLGLSSSSEISVFFPKDDPRHFSLCFPTVPPFAAVKVVMWEFSLKLLSIALEALGFEEDEEVEEEEEK